MSNLSVDSTLAVKPDLAAADLPLEAGAAASARKWPALVALALGAVIIFGVGFTSGVAHNAAHDTRHAMTFPCH